MKGLIGVLLIFSLAIALHAQQDSIMQKSYQKYPSLFLSYQGFQGNTLSVSFGLTKVCNYCDQRNVKFFGVGLELGKDLNHEHIIGAKLVAERGQNKMGIRGTLLLLTNNFREYLPVLRPRAYRLSKKRQII